MIFNIPCLVSYLSELTTLGPGNVILICSLKEIGAVPAPIIAMKPGNILSGNIEELGVLTNPVVAEEV
jgi:2-keto-4-pentenoate hydratase/2-oxohepta-3-ene-1,7-dioic acid hydratase in catechol pathway|tara:strand:+ start:17878 stop:18081 length:204 start_codon:yes stop_codon:yes gene_type:complete